MGLWEFLTVIIIAGILGEAFKQHSKSKRVGREDELWDRIEALEAQVGSGSIEERVRTLEAIVTDDRFHLDREIKSLS